MRNAQPWSERVDGAKRPAARISRARCCFSARVDILVLWGRRGVHQRVDANQKFLQVPALFSYERSPLPVVLHLAWALVVVPCGAVRCGVACRGGGAFVGPRKSHLDLISNSNTSAATSPASARAHSHQSLTAERADGPTTTAARLVALAVTVSHSVPRRRGVLIVLGAHVQALLRALGLARHALAPSRTGRRPPRAEPRAPIHALERTSESWWWP